MHVTTRKVDLAKALDLTSPATEEELVGAGAALIRSWHKIEESKTAVLKDLARVIVHLRSRFRTVDGDVDWAGHSWEYRQAAARMYDLADVPPDSVAGVQASIRYHIGNVLREAVQVKELKAVGLLPTSPRERLRVLRERTQALADAGQALSLPEGTPGRFVASLAAARAAMEAAAEDIPRLPTNAMLAAANEVGAVIECANVTLEAIQEALAGAASATGEAYDAAVETDGWEPSKRGTRPGRPRRRRPPVDS